MKWIRFDQRCSEGGGPIGSVPLFKEFFRWTINFLLVFQDFSEALIRINNKHEIKLKRTEKVFGPTKKTFLASPSGSISRQIHKNCQILNFEESIELLTGFEFEFVKFLTETCKYLLKLLSNILIKALIQSKTLYWPQKNKKSITSPPYSNSHYFHWFFFLKM